MTFSQPPMSAWWPKYMAYIKAEGRGTITHKPELDHSFNEGMYELAGVCMKVCALIYFSLNVSIKILDRQ